MYILLEFHETVHVQIQNEAVFQEIGYGIVLYRVAVCRNAKKIVHVDFIQ